MVLDHNGLFARRFPIAFSGFYATDLCGFYQRRFDLFAINGLSCNRGWTLLLVKHFLPALSCYPVGLVIRTLRDHCPSNASSLVCQSDRRDILMPCTGNAHDPFAKPISF